GCSTRTQNDEPWANRRQAAVSGQSQSRLRVVRARAPHSGVGADKRGAVGEYRAGGGELDGGAGDCGRGAAGPGAGWLCGETGGVAVGAAWPRLWGRIFGAEPLVHETVLSRLSGVDRGKRDSPRSAWRIGSVPTKGPETGGAGDCGSHGTRDGGRC